MFTSSRSPSEHSKSTPCRTLKHSTQIILSISAISLLISSLLISHFSHTTRHRSTLRRIRPQPREANVAFFLQISNTTVHHLPRLIDRLHHPKNLYVIHFDSKIPSRFVNATMRQIHLQAPSPITNIHVMPSELVTYRGISMTMNTLSAMNFLLESDHPWDYFINLSGADYPLSTPSLMRKLLGEALHLEPLFFTFGKRERWLKIFRTRALEFHYDEALNLQRGDGMIHDIEAESPLFNNMKFTPAFGEAWMLLPRSFCEYCTRSTESRKLLVAMGYMTSSPEHYFVTLAYNNPRFNSSIIPNAMRQVIWRAYNMSNGRHPLDLDSRDESGYIFEGRLRESTKFHARKFKHANSGLMDRIDEFSDERQHVRRIESSFRGQLIRLRGRRRDGMREKNIE